jgi:general stress protein YciG
MSFPMSIPDEDTGTGTAQATPRTKDAPTGAAKALEGKATPAGASSASATGEERRPRRRGFAAMDQTRVKEIASKGGKAAHAAGTAHQFSSDEARTAGRKGGMAPHARRGGTRRHADEVTDAESPRQHGDHSQHAPRS